MATLILRETHIALEKKLSHLKSLKEKLLKKLVKQQIMVI